MQDGTYVESAFSASVGRVRLLSETLDPRSLLTSQRSSWSLMQAAVDQDERRMSEGRGGGCRRKQ